MSALSRPGRSEIIHLNHKERTAVNKNDLSRVIQHSFAILFLVQIITPLINEDKNNHFTLLQAPIYLTRTKEP